MTTTTPTPTPTPTTIHIGLAALLEHMLKIGASDLYLTVDSPPVYRVDGVGYSGKYAATSGEIDAMVASILTATQLAEFRRELEMNLAVSHSGARFRVNVFRQRGATGMVVRLVRSKIQSLADLKHPPVLRRIALEKRGLVLLVGGTGSGKSTTLAALVDHRNSEQTGHIVTVEDPIEFVHAHKKCVVTQREVGVDTLSYAAALKNTLRQAPDLILIGEIRDAETMEAAIAFAETGHLCVSTLHANSADQAIERILNFFPAARHHEICLQLSLNVRAIVSQRLVPQIGGGRAAALEILLDTPRIKDLLKRGEIGTLKDAMDQSTVEGCQTFDGALLGLWRDGRIAVDDALAAADSPNNLRLRVERLKGGAQRSGLRLARGSASAVAVAAGPPLSGSASAPASGVLRVTRPPPASAASASSAGARR